MRIEEGLDQGTEIWHSWRRAGIGGSDASLIAAYFIEGYDWPWGNWAGADIYKLWLDKTSTTPIKKNPFEYANDPRAFGTAMEPVSREQYILETGNFIEPTCVTSTQIPMMRVSLDGWDAENMRAVELKNPTEPDLYRKALEGEVPSYYYAQCQHAMEVTGTNVMDYVVRWDGKLAIVPVIKDSAFVLKLIDAEKHFYQAVRTQKFNLLPKAGEFDFDQENPRSELTLQWKSLMDLYFSYQAQMRRLEAEERKVKLEMAKLMPRRTTKGYGGKVTLSVQEAIEIAAKPPGTRAGYLKMEVKKQ